MAKDEQRRVTDSRPHERRKRAGIRRRPSIEPASNLHSDGALQSLTAQQAILRGPVNLPSCFYRAPSSTLISLPRGCEMPDFSVAAQRSVFCRGKNRTEPHTRSASALYNRPAAIADIHSVSVASENELNLRSPYERFNAAPVPGATWQDCGGRRAYVFRRES